MEWIKKPYVSVIGKLKKQMPYIPSTSDLRVINNFTGRASRGRIFCKSPFYNQSNREHPELDLDELSDDLAKGSPTNRFDQNYLTVALTVRVEAPDEILGRLSPYQLTTLKTPVPDCQGDSQHIKPLLLIWFDIFNSAVFFGSLTILRRDILLYNRTHPMALRGAVGGFMQVTGAVGRLSINQDTDPELVMQNDQTEHVYISILLHEMLHGTLGVIKDELLNSDQSPELSEELGPLAFQTSSKIPPVLTECIAFFAYYTCECKTCREDEYYEAGHGPNWADAALAIQEAVDNLVDWRVDLNVAKSVLHDQDQYKWKSTFSQNERWGLNAYVKKVKQERVAAAAAAASEEAQKTPAASNKESGNGKRKRSVADEKTEDKTSRKRRSTTDEKKKPNTPKRRSTK